VFLDVMRLLIPKPLSFGLFPATTKILARCPNDDFDLLLFSYYANESQTKVWEMAARLF